MSISKDGKIDLNTLTVLEAEELSRLLEDKWGISSETMTPMVAEEGVLWIESETIEITVDRVDLSGDDPDWALADLVSLGTEARERARSIDQTLSYVQARCRQVMAVWNGHYGELPQGDRPDH